MVRKEGKGKMAVNRTTTTNPFPPYIPMWAVNNGHRLISDTQKCFRVSLISRCPVSGVGISKEALDRAHPHRYIRREWIGGCWR